MTIFGHRWRELNWRQPRVRLVSSQREPIVNLNNFNHASNPKTPASPQGDASNLLAQNDIVYAALVSSFRK